MNKHGHLLFSKHWKLTERSSYLLGQCHSMVKYLSEMPLNPEDYNRLLRVWLIKGAKATTAIEGNTLSEEEVEQVADGESLAPSKKYQEIEVKNILDAMGELLIEVTGENVTQRITPELLLRFHEMIGADLGEHFDAVPGRWRTDERVVGRYRCPPHVKVVELVKKLCNWLATEFGYPQGNRKFSDGVVEALVAHVYLEWIHPFGDGNGRTGRLLEFYILLRIGVPNVASLVLSNHYNLTRPEYYRQLDEAAKTKDLSNFIEYALLGFRDGLNEVLSVATERQFRNAWRSYIYDVFADHSFSRAVFKRRRDLMLSMPIDEPKTPRELTEINPEILRQYASVSDRTVMRDLEFLVSTNLASKSGSKYVGNSAILLQQTPSRFPIDL